MQDIYFCCYYVCYFFKEVSQNDIIKVFVSLLINDGMVVFDFVDYVIM